MKNAEEKFAVNIYKLLFGDTTQLICYVFFPVHFEELFGCCDISFSVDF